MSTMSEIYYGEYYFETALLYRNALLLSSLLVNIEAWYNVTQTEINQLEMADEQLLRRILSAPATASKASLYLELGIIPIRYIIKNRRLNFLQDILKENENSLTNKILMRQMQAPNKNDWINMVLNDIRELNLNLNLEDIKKMSKSKFKKITKEACQRKGFEYLEKLKRGQNKIRKLNYKQNNMQKYLKPGNKLSIDEMKNIYLVRTRNLNVKDNFRNYHKDNTCPIKKCKNDDTQLHLYYGTCLNRTNYVINRHTKYSDLFGEDLEKIIEISRIIRSNFEHRKHILSPIK